MSWVEVASHLAPVDGSQSGPTSMASGRAGRRQGQRSPGRPDSRRGKDAGHTARLWTRASSGHSHLGGVGQSFVRFRGTCIPTSRIMPSRRNTSDAQEFSTPFPARRPKDLGACTPLARRHPQGDASGEHNARCRRPRRAESRRDAQASTFCFPPWARGDYGSPAAGAVQK